MSNLISVRENGKTNRIVFNDDREYRLDIDEVKQQTVVDRLETISLDPKWRIEALVVVSVFLGRNFLILIFLHRIK